MSQMVVEQIPTVEPAASGAETVIKVKNLKKAFRRKSGEVVNAVDDVSLDVRAGEMVVLLGPSGCGKTTLLRCIAGLEDPDGGTVELEERRVFADGVRPVPPEKRGIGMMFQSYALWPHMSVARNVAYPLAAKRFKRSAVTEHVEEILEIVGVANLRDQYPAQLSGGQQQRVALARSLVARPRMMLFDEPLSNVDAKVREQLRYEILEMQRQLGFAGIYVTHDQDEAMKMATKLAVLRQGKIAQIDTPERVYGYPLTRYVADFVGVMNRWRIDKVVGPGAADTLLVDVGPLGVLEIGRDEAVPLLQDGNAEFDLITRPETVTMSGSPTGDINERSGVIQRVTFAGAHSEYLVQLDNDGGTLTAWTHNAGTLPRESGRVFVGLPSHHLRVVAD